MGGSTKIWRETGFVDNDPWVIETDDLKDGDIEAGNIKASGIEAGDIEADNIKPGGIEAGGTKADGIGAGAAQKPLLPLDAFIEKAETSNDVGLGVLISPADDVRRLEPYLYRIEIVALAFPAFNDGRAFSHASLLRERLAYRNELRAVGDVLIDQVPLMLRCGIDSFAVANATALQRLAENRLPGIAQHYQPSAQTEEKAGGYSWRRVS